MFDIDDFFVSNNINNININTVIDRYNYFKSSSIPENYLKQHFKVLLQDTDNKMMFKKNEIKNKPLQEFWTLRFIDMAENYNDDFSVNNISSLDKGDLKEIINICFKENIVAEIKNFLNARGISLYFIEPLIGTKIDGAVYITGSSSIAVGLTVRFERLDHLLFSLLHELSHIILHKQHLTGGIVSITDSQEEIELEANRLAKDSIISPEIYRVCKPKKTKISSDLLKFAAEYNVHPALLAGIIRKDTNNYRIFNDIIQKIKINRNDLYE
ncbi:MAG: ImmA/IrrE family metallo-endopeptidase [Treponema sp.]|nr:ImmA/IrrE family metallo-endopeptidase [Treponema sp.]